MHYGRRGQRKGYHLPDAQVPDDEANSESNAVAELRDQINNLLMKNKKWSKR